MIATHSIESTPADTDREIGIPTRQARSTIVSRTMLGRSKPPLPKSPSRSKTALLPLLLLHVLTSAAPTFTSAFSAAPAPLISDKVLAAIDRCYPPASYSNRRSIAYDAALSQTQTFTAEGIPLAGDSMVYGEFELPFFAKLLQCADPQAGETFVDAGSGAGRLVLAAALLHPTKFANCHGVELSSPLHDAGIAARYEFENIEDAPPIAPCQYTLSDCMDGDGLEAIKSADIVFSYAVTWANDETHAKLVRSLAQNLPDGARIISIDLALKNEVVADMGNVSFELIAKEVGPNEETCEETVGLVYRLIKGG